MSRSVWFAVLSAVALSACVASRPGTWSRLDGKSVDAKQLDADATICMGERAKANLGAQRRSCGVIGCLEQEAEINRGLADVVKGCMAQKGYSLVTSR